MRTEWTRKVRRTIVTYYEHIIFVDFKSQKFIRERASMSRSTNTHGLSCLIYIWTFIAQHREHSVSALETPSI